MLEAVSLAAGYAGIPLFQNVDLRLPPARILGLFGASGSGKSTLGRALAGLHPPLAGQVRLNGDTLYSRTRTRRQPVQYLHQNPILAMNPRWRMDRILAEAGPPDPELQAQFGIHRDWLKRFPHELSDGQLQRFSILRAITARPRFLVADEVTAPLDPIAQAQLWAALQQLVALRGIGILAISHDRALLGKIADMGSIAMPFCGFCGREDKVVPQELD